MRSHYAIEKPWNQSNLAQEFIKYSIEVFDKNFSTEMNGKKDRQKLCVFSDDNT